MPRRARPRSPSTANLNGALDDRSPHAVPCGCGSRGLAARRREPCLEPLDGWELVSRAAEADAGRAILPRIDSVNVVDCQSWRYDDPPSRLASRLGLQSINVRYSSAGGTSPQVLVVDAASAIQRGSRRRRSSSVASSFPQRRHSKEPGAALELPEAATEVDHSQNTLDPIDVAYGIYTARWGSPSSKAAYARVGVPTDATPQAPAELLAPLTAVAAANPRAWFPVSRTPDELSTISADNRMVSYPYTKLMTAFMDVDMAAAVVVCSHELANDLDISLDRRVYLRGWGIAHEHDLVAARGAFSPSPAMTAAAGDAMTSAGIGVDDIEHLDLYSCFPVALEFACEALGVAAGDTRPLTVTGGLPYFGGPASNYTTHALAELVTRLRLAPDLIRIDLRSWDDHAEPRHGHLLDHSRSPSQTRLRREPTQVGRFASTDGNHDLLWQGDGRCLRHLARTRWHVRPQVCVFATQKTAAGPTLGLQRSRSAFSSRGPRVGRQRSSRGIL